MTWHHHTTPHHTTWHHTTWHHTTPHHTTPHHTTPHQTRSHDMTWHDMTWHDMTWHDMTWHDMTWHDMTWHDITWHDMTWHDMTWHDMTWHDITWHDIPSHHVTPLLLSSCYLFCGWVEWRRVICPLVRMLEGSKGLQSQWVSGGRKEKLQNKRREGEREGCDSKDLMREKRARMSEILKKEKKLQVVTLVW